MIAASRWTAVAAGVICLATSGDVAAQGTPQGAPPPAVSVAPVTSREIVDTGSFIGRIVAIDKVDIVARVPGFIEQRYFTEGQTVKTGDLLFRIEQAMYKAAVEQQEANLAKARATETNAQVQLDRGKELVRGQNIPQSTVDQRAADAGAAKAEVMVAQAALEQAKINFDYTEIRSTVASGWRITRSAIWSGRRREASQPSSARIRST
jgi:membrane fusion protein, multidrug efflux system